MYYVFDSYYTNLQKEKTNCEIFTEMPIIVFSIYSNIDSSHT